MKVAFLCDGLVVKKWQLNLFKNILDLSFFEKVYIINQNVEVDNSSKLSGEKNKFWKYYQGIDNKIFDKDNLLSNECLTEYKKQFEIINLKTMKKGMRDYVEDCSKYNIDVAIRFGWRIVDGDILNSFKNGILSLHHGDNRCNRGGPWCFWEMYLKQKLIGVTLQKLTSNLDGGEVLERGFIKTDFSSLSKNRKNAINVGNQLILKHLSLLKENKKLDKLDDKSYFYDNEIYKTPSLRRLSYFFLQTISFIIKRKIKTSLYNEHWSVSFKENTLNSEINFQKLKKIKNPKSSFLADPFVYCDDNYELIFLERYCYEMKKGLISVYDIKTGVIEDIIEEPYHLSYPHIFKLEGKFYMIPQSSNRCVDLYEAKSFPNIWKKKKTLLCSDDKYFSDANLVIFDDIYYLIVNEFNDNHDSNRFMNIYYSINIFSEFKAHKMNPIKIDDSSTRNAGEIKKINGDFIRFSQNCEVSYGGSINVMKIDRVDLNKYEESIIDHIKPSFSEKIDGIHTLNFNEKYLVLDTKYNKLKFLCKR